VEKDCNFIAKSLLHIRGLFCNQKRNAISSFLKQNPVILCLKIDFMQSIDFSPFSSKRKITSFKLCFPYGSANKMSFLSISVFVSLLCCSFVQGEFAGEFHSNKQNNFAH
jgi:ABC-type microcin C transport system permease subunit YejE